jgi:hypothetical protein
MARFQANSPEDFALLVDKQRKAIDFTVKAVKDTGTRKLVQGGRIIEARAKEILTEKNHVVTGALRRSVNTQPVRAPRGLIEVEVGSFLEYAPWIEALPTRSGSSVSQRFELLGAIAQGTTVERHSGGEGGGYLNPAAVEKFPAVTDFLSREWLTPTLRRSWEPRR